MQPIASSRSASHAASLLPPIAPFAPSAIMPLSRACAPAISSGTNAVSGMFFQYLRGISLSIAPIFTRAGLKIDGVIGLPHLLDRIAVGRVGLGRAGAFAQRLAVPVQRHLGRQDRPAHAGEAVDEEAGIGADDMMLGLEPGDEARVRHRRRPRGSARRRASCGCRGGPSLAMRLEPADAADRRGPRSAWARSRRRDSSV